MSERAPVTTLGSFTFSRNVNIGSGSFAQVYLGKQDDVRLLRLCCTVRELCVRVCVCVCVQGGGAILAFFPAHVLLNQHSWLPLSFPWLSWFRANLLR